MEEEAWPTVKSETTCVPVSGSTLSSLAAPGRSLTQKDGSYLLTDAEKPSLETLASPVFYI